MDFKFECNGSYSKLMKGVTYFARDPLRSYLDKW